MSRIANASGRTPPRVILNASNSYRYPSKRMPRRDASIWHWSLSWNMHRIARAASYF